MRPKAYIPYILLAGLLGIIVYSMIPQQSEPKAEDVTVEGYIVRGQPGMKPDVWYLATTDGKIELAFNGDSRCGSDEVQFACHDELLMTSNYVEVGGWKKNNAITVGVLRELNPPQDENSGGTGTVTATDDIVITKPTRGAAVSSPLSIEGEARGSWFFEATFPVMLTNWDGLIIGEGYATANGDWMTDDLVPFTASIIFTDPEVGQTGTLILKKANASGLPENDESIEIPISFPEAASVRN